MRSPCHIGRTCAQWLVATLAVAGLATAAQSVEFAPAKSPLLRAMHQELKRSFDGLRKKGTPPPYFLSYEVVDTDRTSIRARNGAIAENNSNRVRFLDIDLRVGDYAFDNTHPVRGNRFKRMMSFVGRVHPIPIEDDIDAIRGALWLHTETEYKHAVENLIEAQTNAQVKVEAEDQSADFSEEPPVEYIGEPIPIHIDTDKWERILRNASEIFTDYPNVLESSIELTAQSETKYFVSTEGTLIQHSQPLVRLFVTAETKAGDGMDLFRYESFDGHSIDALPTEAAIIAVIRQMADDLMALREAPVIEPYTGPAILSGRAAGVFFHEIFGHRVEGHRQKDEDEGQTFTKKVGKQILPEYISIYDDPTLEKLGGVDLRGYYQFDDEGVPSRRVTIVKNGVLKNFLMSRSPIEGFAVSNGHGRKQPGRHAVGRQGNLIVETSKSVSEEHLREMLIKECERQGNEFGLVFKDISGGFTMTGRIAPQAYNVRPIMVYRVFTDGRMDELVRGADLIGTPLISFSKILGCGENTDIFNGTCGAESGLVPVSACAPSILTGQIEIQKKEKSPDRPPLLLPPVRGGKS